ncbi:MAG TPA: 2-oxo-4-hydroxy-4-carboxy-5-ureidoimidazoline decarboxylase [Candidatus Deferrimicrobiaceae bacterium]|nr:2-oxo-4-hydroxy-4-carboxy-5-ureidoimidazoline decarboxylase [Candidatus Deferrimicrobiaceae bacterium]
MTLDGATLRSATARAFVASVGPLFETAPGFLFRLASARPFESTDALFERAREIAHGMPEPLQLELVDAHPRLGAPPAGVSAMSYREQGYHHEAAATGGESDAAVAAELERLNREYEGRFGFRYCVFVAGRARSALIPEMAAALERERDAELHRAIDAVVDIAADRHRRTA